jgi:hypothetical protein
MKFIFPFLMACAINTQSFSQSFMHSGGVNLFVLHAKINNPTEKYTFDMFLTHLSYFPRIILTKSEKSSVSLGSPLGAGIGIINNAGNGPSGVVGGVDLPLVVDYNIGCKSSPENDEDFGVYLGAGFGYMHTNWTDNVSNSASSYGPLVRAGLRVRFDPDQRSAMTLGIFYKYGLEKLKFKTFGVNVMVDF